MAHLDWLVDDYRFSRSLVGALRLRSFYNSYKDWSTFGLYHARCYSHYSPKGVSESMPVWITCCLWLQDKPLSILTSLVTRNKCKLIKQVLGGYILYLNLWLSFAVLQWDMRCIMASRSSLMEWSQMTIYAEWKSI